MTKVIGKLHGKVVCQVGEQFLEVNQSILHCDDFGIYLLMGLVKMV